MTPFAHSRRMTLKSAGFSKNDACPAPSMNFVVSKEGSHFVYIQRIGESAWVVTTRMVN